MKIFCIGRNYAAHAKEMNSAVPDKPMVFMKPSTALLKPGAEFYYPDFATNIHYECEVVLKICKNGRHIQRQFASNYFQEISLGLDLTERSIQKQCKDKGHPWEIAKSWDHSAPIGKFVSKEEFTSMDSITFELEQNGKTVQSGNTRDLIFDFETLIVYISKLFTLQNGDLIYTGTPEGVGPINKNDNLIAKLGGTEVLNLNIK